MKINLKKILPAVLFPGAIFPASAQNEVEMTQIPETVSEYKLDKPANIIFTNPAPDCSSSMNISWVTPPGKKWYIEVTDDYDGKSYEYDYDEAFLGWDSKNELEPDGKLYKFPFVYKCDTFKGIPTKLGDGTSLSSQYEFDKHGFELFDLEPDTDYSYRIVTLNDSTGENEYSDRYQFRTAGASEWKAAVIGDFHHYSPLKGRIRSVGRMLNVLDSVSGGFDWVLSPGDVVAFGGSLNAWEELSQQPYFKNYMWAIVEGNHDNMASDKTKSDNFIRDTHFFPYNGYDGQNGVVYRFKYGDVLFLMLNNEAMRSEAGTQRAIEWMKREVRHNPSKYLVVVEHYQWLFGTNGENSQLQKFQKTFDELGVDLAISGNNHVYLRTLPLYDNAPVEPEEGTFYVVTPSSDNERGRNMKKIVANEDLISKRWTEGGKTIGGMLMDVNPERIEMTLYDRYGNVHDTFTVPAKR